MNRSKRIISFFLAILMVFELLPLNVFSSIVYAANGQKFDVAIRVIKQDGTNETYYGQPYATFNGGVINENTAPKIPGLKFIKAYVRDIEKSADIKITSAEYREIGKRPEDKRVFFKMANTADDGVESSYTYIDTYPTQGTPPLNKEGVTNKIFFEYYETARVFKVNYVPVDGVFVVGPEYVENKGGQSTFRFTVSVPREKKIVIYNNDGTQLQAVLPSQQPNLTPNGDKIKIADDISTPTSRVYKYEYTINKDTTFAIRSENILNFTVNAPDNGRAKNDWTGNNVPGVQMRPDFANGDQDILIGEV